jgi:putative transposase
LSGAPARLQREKADYEQHLLIKDIFLKRNRKAGWRVIRMNLERQTIIMNPKKSKRLMKKYGLITNIWHQNPYKHLSKATQEHRTAPNVLNRRFDQGTPYKPFGTDITYVYDGNGQRSYLSTILDIATDEILAHRVFASLGMDLSLEVIAQASTKLGNQKSMSRKGNCLDNAPENRSLDT